MHEGHIMPKDNCYEKNKTGREVTKGRPEA